MMPLIQPLPSSYTKPTEYQKERAGFAEMEVELRQRKGGARLVVIGVRRLLMALRRNDQRVPLSRSRPAR